MQKIIKSKTVCFEVDVQYGFTVNCPAELPVPGATAIVPYINETAKFAKYRVMSKDIHSLYSEWIADEHHPQGSPIFNSPNLDLYWNPHCILGTLGCSRLPGLPHATSYDFIIYKGIEYDMHPYSACYHDLTKNITTGVIEFLKSKEVTSVLLTGLALDFCVIATAYDLKDAGFEVIINLDACRSVSVFGSAKTKAIKDGIIFIDNISELELCEELE